MLNSHSSNGVDDTKTNVRDESIETLCENTEQNNISEYNTPRKYTPISCTAKFFLCRNLQPEYMFHLRFQQPKYKR